MIKELGKTPAANSLVKSTIAASAITLGGSEEQKAKWLLKLANDKATGTLAFDEGPRHDQAKLAAQVQMAR